MPCTTTITPIEATQNIGNSLDVINTNFSNLKTGTCDNYDTLANLNTLLGNLQTTVSGLVSAVEQGAAKAWVKFHGGKDQFGNVDGLAGNRYIYSSYNVDYVYKATTASTPTLSGGDYRVFFKPGVFTTDLRKYVAVSTCSETIYNGKYGWAQTYFDSKDYVGVRVHSTDPATVSTPWVVNPEYVSVVVY